MKYPKLETLFERKDDFSVDTMKFRRPEFPLIRSWVLQEKIDGTNIRIEFNMYDDRHIRWNIFGRTDKAQIPEELDLNIRDHFDDQFHIVERIMRDHNLSELTLFGEGYGPKIQNGGDYAAEQKFILFDVAANDRWLGVKEVQETAEQLNLDHVPILGEDAMINDAIIICKNGFKSQLSDKKMAEGVVAKTKVPLYDRRGERICWKLKNRDFK